MEKQVVGDLSRDELEALIDSRVRALVKTACCRDDQEEQAVVGANKIANQTVVGSGKHDEKEESPTEWHSPLSDSTYTLMYLYPFNSQGFWYGTFVFVLQMSIIVLTVVDTVDTEATTNPLRIPPMVDITVTMAQGLTLFILAAWMADLIEAIMRLQEGYHPELLPNYPGATFSTWLVSCLAQLSAGLFLLAGTFILTMQASTVFKVMLNIKTLIFMALIDDLGFGMTKKGFVTCTLQAEAKSVGGIQVKKRKCTNLYRRILYLLALIGL